MRLSRLILFLIFVLFTSAALAAKPEKSLVCHVGNELGSNSESYQDNPNCDILPPYDGDPADYICPDAGKVDLILVSKKAKHIGNDAHSFLDDTDYLWEDYSPEEGIGDDPLDFEEGDVPGIDRGCELDTVSICPCNASTPSGAVFPLWNADFPWNAWFTDEYEFTLAQQRFEDGFSIITTLSTHTIRGSFTCRVCESFVGCPVRVDNLSLSEMAACDAELTAIIYNKQ